MRRSFSFSVVAVVACLLTPLCQPTALLRYVPVVYNSTGVELCAVDKPSAVSSSRMSSRLQCAVECMASSCCVMYQFNSTSKQCQYFSYLPRNYRNATDCRSFCESPTEELFTVDTGSLPLTVGGQLFYSCATDDVLTAGNAWCAAAKKLRNTCAPDDYGFVARNATVNVTFPMAQTTLSLMSVYGWLTVLSRVNSSFPLGLTYTTYQEGFGDITSNFWLGLERTYQLTNTAVNGGQSYRLRFEFLSSASQRWYSEEYDWFYLDSSATSYVLHVSATGTGDAGDVLNLSASPLNGKQFSTSSVCAIRFGGWWYYSNMGCGLGRFFGNASNSGCLWMRNNVNIVDVVRMMIKPNSL